MQLLVLAPGATPFQAKNVHWVKMQLADGGGIGIWPGHAPLLAETVAAPLRYADELGEHSFPLDAGILLVEPDGVTVYTARMAAGGETVAALGGTAATQRLPRLIEALRVGQQRAADEGMDRGDVT